MLSTVYLSIGSNLGNSYYFINSAINLIENYLGKIVSKSSYYLTEPWQVLNQNNFINICLKLLTSYQLISFFSRCREIEFLLGKMPNNHHLPRTIDIDILFFDDLIFKQDNLIIPHPALHLRKFVLQPLNEIAFNFIHPELKMSIENLYLKLADNSIVKKI